MKIVRLEDVDFPLDFRELTPEELKEAYALAKAAFTADDLKFYTEVDLDKGVPVEEFLAELEELQKQFDQGKK